MKKLIIIIGPTRTATTSAWTYLTGADIKDVNTSKIKENYFLHYDCDITKYLLNFSNHADTFIDFAPSLFHHDHALMNLSLLDIEKSVYVTLRNPIDLYLSSYRYNLLNSKIDCSLSDYLTPDIFDRFSYEKRLGQIKELLPNTDIKFINFDELKKDMSSVFQNIFANEINDKAHKLPSLMVQLNQSNVRYRYPNLIKSLVKFSAYMPATKRIIKKHINWPSIRSRFFEKEYVDNEIVITTNQQNRINKETDYYNELISMVFSDTK